MTYARYIIYKTHVAGPCEIGLLLEDNTKCRADERIQSIIATAEIWHYIRNNQWLFVLNKPGSISIRCPTQNVHFQLPNSGILSLPNTCTAQSREFTFFPHADIISQATLFHFISKFNFTGNETNEDIKNFIHQPILKNFDSTQLQSLINQQNEEVKTFYEEFQRHYWTKSNWIPISTLIIFIFCIIIYCIYKCLRKNRKINSPLPVITFNIISSPSTPDLPGEDQPLRRSFRLMTTRLLRDWFFDGGVKVIPMLSLFLFNLFSLSSL